MKRKNWYWDLNIPYNKIKQILEREDDPRFPRLAGVFLARTTDPKQVFELISPAAFCRRYRAIENIITSDEWTKEKASFWKSTYLRLIKELREKGEKVRRPAKVVLDEFDRDLIKQIKECRKKALMSQKEIAEFMGYSQQYISGMETGREKVTIDFLKKLAELTGERIDVIISKQVR